MTNKPLKQKYLVVEVRLSFPAWTEAKDRINQQVYLEPILGEAGEEIVLGSIHASPRVDNKMQLCCWQDQQSFTVGQEIYLTVETIRLPLHEDECTSNIVDQKGV